MRHETSEGTEDGGHRTGIENHFAIKGGRKLRFGYTTGTCAAAAAKASAEMLFEGTCPDYVGIETPHGINLILEPVQPEKGETYAICGVVKDAGDDPDITDGITVFAKVEKNAEQNGTFQKDDGKKEGATVSNLKPQIKIEGGAGVGRITRQGLEQQIGDAAINSVPREMIAKAVKEVAERNGFTGELTVTISVPEGIEIADKTFNPRLGIEGGISILGTSGIVEPMSEAALIESIDIELRQQIEEGNRNLIITLGNYGQEYLKGMDMKTALKISNFVGETIDRAAAHGAEGLLFVAHIGKFIKVAGGIMNTHSRNGDCRAEIMSSCALRAGSGRETALRILDTVTTDEAIEILKDAGVLEDTMKVVTDRISYHMGRRSMDRIRTEALIFSNAHGYLGETDGFSEYLNEISEDRIQGRRQI
ncbi:MAG: cobalamin biosynthesis protein CbiD [Firmicutes bacterium]|nr:cobalamin biosynthesis protein CbiD [Bacillota bacterium]